MGDRIESYDPKIKEIASEWKEAEQRVLQRREKWRAFIASDLQPLLQRTTELLRPSVTALVMKESNKGLERIGLRLDTRSTWLSYKTREAEHAIHERFADLAFEQRPSGLVWVLYWQPYIEEFDLKPATVFLARDFDPLEIDFEEVAADVMGFLRWALAKSYRGARLQDDEVDDESDQLVPAPVPIKGFQP